MVLKFWGVRGTFPLAKRTGTRFGGNTPCATVLSASGGLVVVDAGTGIKAFGESLVKERRRCRRIHLLLTHFHLDHVLGLPFFAPLYDRETTVIFHADAPPEETASSLSRLTTGRLFPVNFMDTAAKKIFRRVPSSPFELEGLRVSHCPLKHPQGSRAYRIESDGGSVVFATDTEHPPEGVDLNLVSLAEGARCLIYDATFSPEEYKAGRQGWGHSTWLAGTRLASEAGVQTLCLSHFSPGCSDRRIDDFVSRAQSQFRRTLALREGLVKRL